MPPRFPACIEQGQHDPPCPSKSPQQDRDHRQGDVEHHLHFQRPERAVHGGEPALREESGQIRRQEIQENEVGPDIPRNPGGIAGQHQADRGRNENNRGIGRIKPPDALAGIIRHRLRAGQRPRHQRTGDDEEALDRKLRRHGQAGFERAKRVQRGQRHSVIGKDGRRQDEPDKVESISGHVPAFPLAV